MNEDKLNALFRAARRLPPPVPEPGFENLVLAAVRREAARDRRETASWFAGLDAMFPRLAWAAALVIALSVAVEAGAGVLGVPNLADGVAQLTDQWLLTGSGF
jgi:hypothetical protein